MTSARKLERRENCGCSVKMERRANRGTPDSSRQGVRRAEEPAHDFWEITPLDFGYMVGGMIVLIGVAMIEGAKAGQRHLDAQGTPAP